MTPEERKIVSVITKYVSESFNEADWYTLGQITGKLNKITNHPRLLRAYSFNDDDYDYCSAEVLDNIFSADSSMLSDVIEHFDIDLWYQQKHPNKYERVFGSKPLKSADFWKDGYLKVFVSHLSSNRSRMSAMKAALEDWGVSAFIAHEDIEASREWRDEVEAGLETMDIMVAVVEPGFQESDWCPQEVGYALGRKIDVIPLMAGSEPFGFFGKYQGINIKGKYPEEVADRIVELLLKKPKHRQILLQSMRKALSVLKPKYKVEMVEILDSWSVATDEQIKVLLEGISLTEKERKKLSDLIDRVDAFKHKAQAESIEAEDEIPF